MANGTPKRDIAHDPRKQKGAKEKAAKMKAKSRTFAKKDTKGSSKASNGSGKSPSTYTGTLGSGMLEGARKAIVGRSKAIDAAVKRSGG